jgi:hypothetical protein
LIVELEKSAPTRCTLPSGYFVDHLLLHSGGLADHRLLIGLRHLDGAVGEVGIVYSRAGRYGTPVDRDTRLCDMRAELVGKLEQRIDGGMLALLGTVHGAISAVDAVPEDVADAAPAVVADDGETIRLTFYSADGAACGIELVPAHAVALAGRLLDAASARLRRGPSHCK